MGQALLRAQSTQLREAASAHNCFRVEERKKKQGREMEASDKERCLPPAPPCQDAFRPRAGALQQDEGGKVPLCAVGRGIISVRPLQRVFQPPQELPPSGAEGRPCASLPPAPALPRPQLTEGPGRAYLFLPSSWSSSRKAERRFLRCRFFCDGVLGISCGSSL